MSSIVTDVSDVQSGAFGLWHHVFQGANTTWISDQRIISGNFFIGLQAQNTHIFATNIPRGSTIVSASMRVTASFNNFAAHTTQINTPDRDDSILAKRIWNRPTQPFQGWRSALWNNTDAQLINTSLGTILETSAGVNNTTWVMRLLNAGNMPGFPQRERLAQRFVCPAGTSAFRTLGQIILQMSRSAVAPTGNVRVHIMGETIDGGLSVPDEAAIATSADVAMSSLTTVGTGGPIQFLFTGANSIELVEGQTYFLVIEPDPYTVNFTNWIGVRHQDQFLVTGQQLHYGYGIGQDWQNSPGTVDANQNSTLDPMGTNVNWNVPGFVAGFQYTTPNLSSLVQIQVDHPSYGSDRAIVINTSGTSGTPNRIWASSAHPTFAPPRLTVTYRPPRSHSIPVFRRPVAETGNLIAGDSRTSLIPRKEGTALSGLSSHCNPEVAQIKAK